MEENKKSNLRRNLKYYFIAGGVSLAFGIALFCLFFFIRKPRVGTGLDNWFDSGFIAGIILVCVGALMGVARDGFFDIFAYGFKQMGSALFSKKAHAYNDYPGYREDKKNKRASSPKLFISVLIVSALFLLVSLFMYLAYCSMVK